MKRQKQKSLDLNKGLTLIQTLQTYRTISREILNKLNELEHLFNELISNPTLCIDKRSDLHLKIAMRIYEMTRSLRKDPGFIKSYPNKSHLIYITMQSMSAAHLTQTDKIPESDNDLLTCANILNKAAYYYLTNDDQNMTEILFKKAGYLISNIKNTRSEEYQATTAKTTAAMDFLCPKKITSDVILEYLKEKQLRILAKLYFDCAVTDIALIHKHYDAISCVNMFEKIKNKTKEDSIAITNTKIFIIKILIAQTIELINNNIYQSIEYCRFWAEIRPNELILSLNIAENVFTQTTNSKHKWIIIQLLKSYCFMKLNDSNKANKFFKLVQKNMEVIKKILPLTKYPHIRSIFTSIFTEIKKFLNLVEDLKHISATQTEEKISSSTQNKNKRKKRIKKRKNKFNPEGSNPNRFFQHPPESPAVEENSEDISATQTGIENPSTPVTTNSFFNLSYESYNDEDIIKLLKDHIKTKVKIESVIPFNELTDKLTKELLTIKDEKCSALILPINCGCHHAFLYMKQNSENPEFFYFELQENIPKNICDKIAELFPNSKIENVTTSNLEATKKITEKYDSFLRTIINHKKYDSLLIYFIECYISHRGELLFERHKEDLSAFADLEYNANQEYLSGISDNTPSMNNTP